MDVLSDVLGTVRLTGRVYGTLELAPPWGVFAAPRDPFIFHIIARGECWFEAENDQPGGATVANRVCDALFVYVIRSVLTQLPEHEASWLRALITPKIGDALRLIHDNPSKDWSVAELGTKVGMSRSAFAER